MVSIIIPLYNAENYILDALRSALIQEVEKEIIIIDDCSTDNSLKTVLDYVKTNHNILTDKTRIVIRKNSYNLGVASTRNLGVDIARGEYVAYLDADDMWTSDKLKKQLLFMREKEADICSTSREIVDENGKSTGRIIGFEKEAITLKDLKRSNRINCSAVLVKKELMKKYPMRHDKDAHEDYYVWLMAVKNGAKVCNIDEPLLKYRDIKGSKSHNKLKAALMTFRTYRYAGYGFIRSLFMMPAYMVNGLSKHMKK